MSDAIEVESGVWSVIDGTRVYELRISSDHVFLNGRAIEIPLEDSRGWNRKRASGTASGPAQLRATMPGKVVRVLVEVGENVVTGQGIVVVEAMKMQNELKSPRDGCVTQIAVKEHATVDAGAVLVTIE